MKVCFVCQYNEGRSLQLELVARKRLEELGLADRIEVTSAGLTPGGGAAKSLRAYTKDQGDSLDELEAHKSRRIESVAPCDYWLVSETYMRDKLLSQFAAAVKGARIISVRGFAQGIALPENDLNPAQAKITDSYFLNSIAERVALFREIEQLGIQCAEHMARLTVD